MQGIEVTAGLVAKSFFVIASLHVQLSNNLPFSCPRASNAPTDGEVAFYWQRFHVWVNGNRTKLHICKRAAAKSNQNKWQTIWTRQAPLAKKEIVQKIRINLDNGQNLSLSSPFTPQTIEKVFIRHVNTWYIEGSYVGWQMWMKYTNNILTPRKRDSSFSF